MMCLNENIFSVFFFNSVVKFIFTSSMMIHLNSFGLNFSNLLDPCLPNVGTEATMTSQFGMSASCSALSIPIFKFLFTCSIASTKNSSQNFQKKGKKIEKPNFACSSNSSRCAKIKLLVAVGIFGLSSLTM